jgi:hypothetical protein
MKLNTEEMALIHFALGLMIENKEQRKKLSIYALEQANTLMDKVLKEMKWGK